MTDEEITKLFEGSFPGLEGYSDSVKLVLEVLVSVNEPVSLELMAKVLETEPFQLEEPLSALDELVREEEGYVSLYSHECIDWLCDPARSGPYALEDTKHGDIGVVLWEAYEDFENSPHQKEVIDWLAKYVVFTSLWESTEDNAKELNGLAHFLSGVGKLESSVGLYLRVLHIVEELFGAKDLQVATAQNNLANAYKVFGEYDQAENLLLKSLGISQEVSGEMSSEVAQALANLGHLYRDQGDYTKAKPYLEQALALRENLKGVDHPETAAALNDFAYLLKDLGEYEQSESLYRRAIDIRQKALGAEHYDTAVTLNNLAILLELKGKYEEPEKLLRQALAIFEKQRGLDHADTAAALCNLANLLRFKGQYSEAESLFKRSIDIYENKLKWNYHPIPHTLFKVLRNFLVIPQTLKQQKSISKDRYV